MISRRDTITGSCLVALMYAAAFWAIAKLPPGVTIATHWGMNGEPNGWMDKWSGTLFLPCIATLILVLVPYMPQIDKRWRHFSDSPRVFGRVLLVILLLLGGAQAVLLGKALSYQFDLNKILCIILGAFYVFLGNIFGKMRKNTLFGIRTPWTMGDDNTWDKTHRISGWVFVIAGALLAMMSFLLPRDVLIVLEICIVIGCPLAMVFYSFLAKNRDRA